MTAPRSSIDDVIDVYKRDVDVTLIRERLKRSVEERLEDLMELRPPRALVAPP